MNILLVEDNLGDARLIRELLSRTPLFSGEIEEASRMAAALQILESRSIDVVLLDLSLPDATGLQGIPRIHALAPSIPIVVLTGLDDESLALRAVEAGAQDYLVKGRVDGAVLVKAMGYAIQRSRAEKITRQLYREQAARALAETGERRFRALAEAIPQIVWEVNGSGLIYLSPRWFEYTGQKADMPVEDRWREALHPDDYQLCLSSFREAMRTSRIWELQYRLRGADGVYRWHLARAMPSLDADGKSVRFYGTATDIDDQKRVQEERSELLKREQQAIDLREQFLAIVGHDLRNPLMSVSLGADLLLDGTEPVTPTQATVIRRIAQSMSRMTKLIEQLMDFARSRAGGEIPIELAEANLSEVCHRVAEECRAANPEQKILVEAEAEVRGYWDSDRLEEVVSNLIGNAVQHGDGSPITLRLGRENSSALLSVHNQGEPIPEAVLPHIFDPFRRGPSKKKSSSIGLGLFITQQIVLSHRGTLAVRSSKNDGTTFSVRLPVEPPATARAKGGA